jgi:hypothetical protein
MGRQKTKVRYPAIKDVAIDVLDHVDVGLCLGQETAEIEAPGTTLFPLLLGENGIRSSIAFPGSKPPVATQEPMGVVIYQDDPIRIIGDGECLDHRGKQRWSEGQS